MFNVRGTKYLCSLFLFPNNYTTHFLIKGDESHRHGNTEGALHRKNTLHSPERLDFSLFCVYPKVLSKLNAATFDKQQLPTACWKPSMFTITSPVNATVAASLLHLL